MDKRAEGELEPFTPDYTPDFDHLVDYAQGADHSVQYMLCGIRSALAPISASLEQADMAVIAIRIVVTNQSTAIAALTPEIRKGKQSYAQVAKNDADTPFTTVQKKMKPTPLFTVKYTRINIEVIVETDGPLPEFITDDNVLDTINKKTDAQSLQFLLASRSPSGNIVLQINATTSAVQGAALTMEIALALDSITI
ncbi:hypothetical protein Q9L58_010493 [Maublancomyces gigas]|uniref:Uncharacterized protein n=1 Tax=Discina gigas TaxID=1032678 RepID=A0ABR3G401_9PEZI